MSVRKQKPVFGKLCGDLGNFTGEFLRGVWKGMGPDVRKKSEREENTSSGRRRSKRQ